MKLIAYHIRILLNSFHPGYVSVFFLAPKIKVLYHMN